jgi:hypothetical protein
VRTRVRWTLTDENGDVVPYASVRVYEADGVTLYEGPLYRDSETELRYANPFNAAPVRLEFYLDRQTRVVLGTRTSADAHEILTPAIEALPGAEEVAYSVDQLSVPDAEDARVLRARTTQAAYWYRQGLGEHTHAGPAPDTISVGRLSFAFSQLTGHTGATVLGGHDEQIDPDLALSWSWGTVGAQYPTWQSINGTPWGVLDQAAQSILTSPTGFAHITAAGRGSVTAGESATALGAYAVARDLDGTERATAIGSRATALGESAAAGTGSYASAPGAVAFGNYCLAQNNAVTLGRLATAPTDGVAVGAAADASNDAVTGSVVLGAKAAVPTRADPVVLVGSPASGAPVPDDGGAEGPALLFQQLCTVLAVGDLQVSGDLAVGGATKKIGFFGHAPAATKFVGDDEVASGIEALDSLIYALRDLGLIRTRKDAVARYSPETLAQTHQPGDQVRAWPDVQEGDPRLVTALGAEPRYTGTDPVVFDAATVPWEFLLTQYPIPGFRHVVVVAQHASRSLRAKEGLAGVFDQPQPLGRTTTSWDTTGLSRHTVDNVTQSPALPVDARKHVYRVTGTTDWRDDSLFILGASAAPLTPGWWGSVAEAGLFDSSWTERAASSYVAGLMFTHNIAQASDWLTAPALDLLRRQQGDTLSVDIFLDQDFPSTSAKRMVQGRVKGFQGITTKAVPLIRLWNFTVSISYTYDGNVSGYWSYLSNPQNYYVELYSFPQGFTGTWDAAALVGRFSLNASGTWSTGTKRVRRGAKRWRLVLKSNLTPVTIDDWVPGAYYDTAVRIYTVDDTGARTLESTVPLQGDGTWLGTTAHEGRVVAELVRRSTGVLYATTDRHLPVDVITRAADADFVDASVRGSIRTAALAVLAYAGAGRQYWAIAGDILRALRLLQAADGSLYTAYDVMANEVEPLGTDVSTRDLAWVGLAALRLGAVTGDPARFEPLVLGIADYLAAQRGETGSISDGTAGTFSTETNALCWLLFRELGDTWGNIAGDIAASLDTHHWDSGLRRFVLRQGVTTRDTRADIWGGLYLLATGQRERARLALRSLAHTKRTGVAVDDSHYSGAIGLSGYLPTGTTGADALDQEATWAALLFRNRYGDPIGEDLSTLRRWTGITPSTGKTAQFLNYTSDGGDDLIVRPSAAVAAQALLLAQRTELFWPAPITGPRVVACRLTVLRLAAGGYQFTYEWAPEDERQPTAYEAFVERSFDDGDTWATVTTRSRKGQISEVRRHPDSIWPWLYGVTWTESGPLTNSTVTRVNIRMRAKVFGSWAATEGRYPNGSILPNPLTIDEPPNTIPA